MADIAPDALGDTHDLNRRRFLIGGTLAAAAGVVYARLPSKSVDFLGKRKLEAIIPLQIG